MKFNHVILFLLNVTCLRAQDIHLKGIVHDAKTSQPIASATLSIRSKNLYFRTDAEGKFDIVSGELALSDSLGFSCVGYQNKKMSVGELTRNNIIEMEPKVNVLSEVKVGIKSPALIPVGSKRKTGYEAYYPHPGNDFAMFMEGSKNIKGTIQTVGFFLTNGHGMFKGGDVTAPFRIRIFDVDAKGIPGRELTKDSIIVYAKKEWAWFDVDISVYHIQNPDSGFYVSYSLLDYSHYKRITRVDSNSVSLSGEYKTYGEKLSHDNDPNARFSTPILCFTNDEFDPSRSYHYAYDGDDNRLRWMKMFYNQSYMIRAAIAPE